MTFSCKKQSPKSSHTGALILLLNLQRSKDIYMSLNPSAPVSHSFFFFFLENLLSETHLYFKPLHIIHVLSYFDFFSVDSF